MSRTRRNGQPGASARAEYRERRDLRYVQEFARAIRGRYPGCSVDIAKEVTEHACAKHSRRIGRTAEGLSAETVDLAVRAHVRHRYTGYDGYLMAGWDRDLAREAVGDDVEDILARWRSVRRPTGLGRSRCSYLNG